MLAYAKTHMDSYISAVKKPSTKAHARGMHCVWPKNDTVLSEREKNIKNFYDNHTSRLSNLNIWQSIYTSLLFTIWFGRLTHINLS